MNAKESIRVAVDYRAGSTQWWKGIQAEMSGDRDGRWRLLSWAAREALGRVIRDAEEWIVTPAVWREMRTYAESVDGWETGAAHAPRPLLDDDVEAWHGIPSISIPEIAEDLSDEELRDKMDDWDWVCARVEGTAVDLAVRAAQDMAADEPDNAWGYGAWGCIGRLRYLVGVLDDINSEPHGPCYGWVDGLDCAGQTLAHALVAKDDRLAEVAAQSVRRWARWALETRGGADPDRDPDAVS